MSLVEEWDKMDETQQDALVVEKVFGWQYIPAGRYGPHVKDGTSWLLPERGLSDIHSDVSAEWTHIGKDKYAPRNWIPRYSTSMDAAWLVFHRILERFYPQDWEHREWEEKLPFRRFTVALLGDEAGCFDDEMFPAGPRMFDVVRKWTPELICKAALSAVIVEDEE